MLRISKNGIWFFLFFLEGGLFLFFNLDFLTLNFKEIGIYLFCMVTKRGEMATM